MTLTQYINKHYSGNQAAFARHADVAPQQVTQWIKAKFIVYEGVLHSPRKHPLPKPPRK